MASLISADGNSYELSEPETLVGRGGREFGDPPKVDVGPLAGGETVSRRHARLRFRTGAWYFFVEATARNPALVSGERITPGDEMPLTDGVHLQLGDVIMTFSGPAVMQAPAPDSTIAGVDVEQTMARQPQPRVEPPVVTPLPTPAQTSTPPAPATPAPAPVAQAVVTGPAAPARSPQPAPWAVHLAGKPAALSVVGAGELKRVNPFRGLMVDEQTWADAHEYHRLQSRLHLLSAHGWGVVEGLEVLGDVRAPGSLVIRPGVAVDSQGQALLVTQERRLPVSPSPGTTLYVTLRFREELAAPQRQWSDADEYTRVVERAECLVQLTPPVLPAMELARLVAEGTPRNAVDPVNPQAGEIDLRFRERLTVRPKPELGVAQLVAAEQESAATSHRPGLRFLLREISLTSGYRARWSGVIRLGEPLPEVSLLILSGSGAFVVSPDAASSLKEFLSGGGVLLADGCRDGEVAAFASSVEALAAQLERKLQPVGRWHPLLTARHLFVEPPMDNGTKLAEGDGLILSTADFGCAWKGGPRDKALSREGIRAAMEIGVNAAVYARHRQRPLDAIDLEG